MIGYARRHRKGGYTLLISMVSRRYDSSSETLLWFSLDDSECVQDFYFRVVDYGIDNCDSLLRTPRRYSKSKQGQNVSTSDTSMPSSPESTRAVRRSDSPNRARGLTGGKEVEMKDPKRIEQVAKSDNLPFKRIPVVSGKDTLVEGGKEVKGIDTDKEMQDVTDMMATVKLVPRQIRFGRGGGGMVGLGSRR